MASRPPPPWPPSCWTPEASIRRSSTEPRPWAEACEYRANFLHLRPKQVVVTGIEPDHFDCYRSIGELEEAFARFVGNVPEYGLVLAQHACSRARRVAAQSRARVETFGFTAAADWSAVDLTCERGRYSFTIVRRRRRLGRVRLRVPGRHSVQNALAAAALAWENGVTAETLVGALERFAGLRRRLEWRGRRQGVTLLDDYAHHPTEVTATLRTVRQIYPRSRLWCVFQPHQVSRTVHLLDELAASLQNADKVLVAEIFRAREPSHLQGGAVLTDLVEGIRRRGTFAARLCENGSIRRLLETELRPGDVLITMGAGDIGKVCNEFLEGLREDRAAG
jgi:UDP-N-acetylmuramate--alanine ligase